MGLPYPQQLKLRPLRGRWVSGRVGDLKQPQLQQQVPGNPLKAPGQEQTRPLQFQNANYKLALAKNNCQQLNNSVGICHVPLPRGQEPAAAAADHPGRGSGCSEALCAPWKRGSSSLIGQNILNWCMIPIFASLRN